MRLRAVSPARDDSGVSTVEFALMAPVLALTLMGLFDLSYNYYADTMIEGAVAKAARDSTLEGFANNPAAVDQAVERAVHRVSPSADVSFERSAYVDYTDVGQAEDYTDTNNDGLCNDNEPFEDVNGNGTWDSDRSRDASNGARDAVLYEVAATYDRMFPMASLLGWEDTVTVRATTVLRNQPYNRQDQTVTVGNCT